MRPRQKESNGVNISKKQKGKTVEKNKSVIPGLNNIPVNYFDLDTIGRGSLGVALLKPNPVNVSNYPDTQNSLGKPSYDLNKKDTFFYFFIEYDDPNNVSFQGIIKSFIVVRTLNPVTVSDVSKMLGLETKGITGITKDQYENDSFYHPRYTNDSGTPLKIRYAELQILLQKTPGRLDDVPIGSPNFDNTPDGVTTRKGPLPSPPYTDFSTSTGGTSFVTIISGGTVSFKDISPSTPWQFAPTGWNWDFGASASPTGSILKNPTVVYGSTGNYTVTLTASNSSGSTTKTKIAFVVVIDQ